MAGPHITVVDDASDLDRRAAALIASTIRSRPDASIVAATGSSPIGAYRLLARHARTGLDVGHVRVFQLDEYLGVGSGDDRSLFEWMMRDLVSPLGISRDRVVRLDASGHDPARACREYDGAVCAAGGFDLAILGLGLNGHLGFNEPPSDPTSATRVVRLSRESSESNRPYWGGRAVPDRAMTAGLSSLLAARRVIVVVRGASKRDILARTLREPPTPWVPASFLQQHADAHIVVDRAAWSERPRSD